MNLGSKIICNGHKVMFVELNPSHCSLEKPEVSSLTVQSLVPTSRLSYLQNNLGVGQFIGLRGSSANIYGSDYTLESARLKGQLHAMQELLLFVMPLTN